MSIRIVPPDSSLEPLGHDLHRLVDRVLGVERVAQLDDGHVLLARAPAAETGAARATAAARAKRFQIGPARRERAGHRGQSVTPPFQMAISR